MNSNRQRAAIDALRCRINIPLMRATPFTKDDIGKVFVLNAEKTDGRVMTKQELLRQNPEEIGAWDEIGEFDAK